MIDDNTDADDVDDDDDVMMIMIVLVVRNTLKKKCTMRTHEGEENIERTNTKFGIRHPTLYVDLVLYA